MTLSYKPPYLTQYKLNYKHNCRVLFMQNKGEKNPKHKRKLALEYGVWKKKAKNTKPNSISF